jgi:hypothetical protein
MPAYLAEYRLIYEQLVLKMGFRPQRLNVLSLGSGCGLDYWGLHFAMNSARKAKRVPFRYTGVDVVDWSYAEVLGEDEVYYLQEDVREQNRLDERGYNVIIFPKSISEFDEDTFEHIRGAFGRTRFEQDSVVLISSLREKSTRADSKRLAELAETMCESHGFECLDSTDKYYGWKENIGIRSVCAEFVYPNDVQPVAGNVLSLCRTYQANGRQCESDCDRLRRKPILLTTYMKWQILRLERDTPGPWN